MRRKSELRRDQLVRKMIHADLVNTRLIAETVHKSYSQPVNEIVLLVSGFPENEITDELKDWYQSLKDEKVGLMEIPINHRKVDLFAVELFADVKVKFINSK